VLIIKRQDFNIFGPYCNLYKLWILNEWDNSLCHVALPCWLVMCVLNSTRKCTNHFAI
jgi:hypothetical protein